MVAYQANDLFSAKESRLGMSSNRLRGLTFAEVMIALAILGVVVVTVIGLFVKLMDASTKGLDQTVAIDIAQNRLDLVASSPANKWGGYVTSTDMTVIDPRSTTTFYYSMKATELSSAGGSPPPVDPPASDNMMGDLYRVDIEVYWWPQDTNHASGSGRVHKEMGRLSVQLSRLVYVENMKPTSGGP